MNDPKRVLIVALGLPLLIGLGLLIKEAIDDGGERNARLYNTAIQATETDRFNYAIDSRQGRLLGYGEFKATQPVKFPEMTQSFGYVDKNKEEYTLHTREVCTTDSEGNESCHTETYYEWDYAGSEQVSTPALKLHGRDYPAGLFNLSGYERRAEACDFTPANTAGWFQDKNGCDGGYYYTDSDTRYYYRVVDTSFTAGFLSDVSSGSLKPLSGNAIDLKNATPEELVKQANDYRTPGTVFIIIWLIVVIGGMSALAYAWVMSDGLWTLSDD